MGQWTTFCILSGNPSKFSYDSKSKKYNWQIKSRAVLKDGSITDIGTCDLGGNFVLNTKSKSIFSFFSSKGEYRVADSNTLFLFNESFKAQGFILSDIVYKYLKKHKDFKKCTKDKNLFTLLKDFIPKNKLSKTFSGIQHISITDDEIFDNQDFIQKKNIWKLTNPDSKSKDGIRNKKRIMKIIDNFVKFSCKSKIKIGKNGGNKRVSKK